ncbi:endoglucanase, partial [Genlisea aurea]
HQISDPHAPPWCVDSVYPSSSVENQLQRGLRMVLVFESGSEYRIHVGGPDSNDGFSDSRSDYSHSEPTTYINATFIAALIARKNP